MWYGVEVTQVTSDYGSYQNFFALAEFFGIQMENAQPMLTIF
jgi:hypothetical protein